MDKFPASVWRRFLAVVDDHLSVPAELLVIGGAAISLEYCSDYLTRDLDTISTVPPELWDAIHHAQRQIQTEYGFAKRPPVEQTGVFDGPESFEERCRPASLSGLRHLRVLVADIHDIALMKMARGQSRDMEALADVHRHSPLDLPTLCVRYGETESIGPRERFRTSFLVLVERLYGAGVADALEPRIVELDAIVGRGTPGEWHRAAFAALPPKATPTLKERECGQMKEEMEYDPTFRTSPT